MVVVTTIGSYNLDLVTTTRTIPSPGQTALGSDLHSIPGGKGRNQAVAAHRTGVESRLLAAIGRDAFGAVLRRELVADGVSDSQLTEVDRATGVALIVVSESGENVITVAAGANTDLRPSDDAIRAVLEGASALVLQCEIPVGTATRAAVLARAAGVPVTVNASPIPDDPSELEPLIAQADTLIVNEHEAVQLNATGADWPARARSLLRGSTTLAIVTLGARGSVAATQDEFFVQEPFRVDPVDTTGAGDAFCGAFVAERALGSSVQAALRYASAAAAMTTLSLGARDSVPNCVQVEAWLEGRTPPGV